MVVAAKKEVNLELLPFVRLYKDGTVERLYDPGYVPPSPHKPTTSVLSKDIAISHEIKARLYLPNLSATNLKNTKLPILVYFHGGGFCIESAFSVLCHPYMNTLASLAKALIVSVDYRLAPEHLLPTAYEDCWTALQWVASHYNLQNMVENSDPWLIQHGNPSRLYIGGDSAGANIAHNIAMRAGTENLNGSVKIHGAFLSHPYFWGSKPIGSETNDDDREKGFLYKSWMCSYPCAPGGIDNPLINPFVKGAPSLCRLGCHRLLVCVASEDELRVRGIHYCDAVRECGWEGDVELFEVGGEGHGFHIMRPESENAKKMIKCLAAFLQQ